VCYSRENHPHDIGLCSHQGRQTRHFRLADAMHMTTGSVGPREARPRVAVLTTMRRRTPHLQRLTTAVYLTLAAPSLSRTLRSLVVCVHADTLVHTDSMLLHHFHHTRKQEHDGEAITLTIQYTTTNLKPLTITLEPSGLALDTRILCACAGIYAHVPVGASPP
jgi:hypothetical protein